LSWGECNHDDEAAVVPEEGLHGGAVAVEEHEQTDAHGVVAEAALDLGAEAADGLERAHGLKGDVKLETVGDQHSASMRRRGSVASKPGGTLMRWPT
jgi:hypothetical protein